MIMKVNVFGNYTCKNKKCNYKWVPRKINPKECPKCSNKDWNKFSREEIARIAINLTEYGFKSVDWQYWTRKDCEYIFSPSGSGRVDDPSKEPEDRWTRWNVTTRTRFEQEIKDGRAHTMWPADSGVVEEILSNLKKGEG